MDSRDVITALKNLKPEDYANLTSGELSEFKSVLIKTMTNVNWFRNAKKKASFYFPSGKKVTR